MDGREGPADALDGWTRDGVHLLGLSTAMKKVLMVCTGNLDRSPTAAMVLAEMCAPMWVTSAGTESWARNQVSLELVEEADVICVMEEAHRRFIVDRFGDSHADKVVVLDIPDNYICWETELVHLLKLKLRAALGLRRRQG
jgi:predicted protein tyrosine phosphatase